MLIGQVERKDFGRLALQEQNYSRLLSDITKLVIEVNEPEMASEAIARAFHIAESGTPGPVAVILPEDLFEEQTEAPSTGRARASSPARARRISTSSPGCWPGRAAAGLGRRRAAPMRARRLEIGQLAEEWVLPVSPDPSPAAAVRRRRIRTTAAIWASACRAS